MDIDIQFKTFSPNLVIILLSFLAFSAQGQYQVIDVETKLPVSYAYINSTSVSEGLISDADGFFTLDSTFRKMDTIVVTCIGYDRQLVLVKTLIERKVIELIPDINALQEVIVTVKKTKFKTKRLGVTKKPRKSNFADYSGTANNGEEKAIWVPNDYSVAGNLKGINIFVSDLGYPDADFRIHVYECNNFQTKPEKELTRSNIIASSTSGNEWVHIDMSTEQIVVGENGCFIGIEWFDSPQSKFHKDTILDKGYTWEGENRKDTIYSRIREGSGVVVGAIHQKYRYSKNKLWYKVDNIWENRGMINESILFTSDTLPDGEVFLRTPDNFYQGVLCINIDVAFPKEKVKLEYKKTRKRKLNKLSIVKQDLFHYSQSNIYELFSSLRKAFESDEAIYALKYLCVYEEGELDEVLSELINLDQENKGSIPAEEKRRIVTHLKELELKLDSSSLKKEDEKHFELMIDNQVYNIVVDKGLWKINPYSYRIYE